MKSCSKLLGIKNAQSRNRTSDTWIFSPLLYQLSYLGIELRGQDLNLRPPGYEPDELPDCSTPRRLLSFKNLSGGRWIRTTESTANRFTVCPLWPLGNSPILKAGDRTRTDNLLITNQLLCQLSHTGKFDQQVSSKMGPIGLEPMTLCL